VPRFSSVPEDALALDPVDRLRLASELIDSVEGPSDAEWTDAWAAELRRRSTGADDREARGLPRGSEWSDVRARLLLELTRP
jgi:putative addiction module component (TIGR02574 family)